MTMIKNTSSEKSLKWIREIRQQLAMIMITSFERSTGVYNVYYAWDHLESGVGGGGKNFVL